MVAFLLQLSQWKQRLREGQHRLWLLQDVNLQSVGNSECFVVLLFGLELHDAVAQRSPQRGQPVHVQGL